MDKGSADLVQLEVAELIELLSKLPQDLFVLIRTPDRLASVTGVKQITDGEEDFCEIVWNNKSPWI